MTTIYGAVSAKNLNATTMAAKQEEPDIYSMTKDELKRAVAIHRGKSTRGWTDISKITSVIPPESVKSHAILQNLQQLWNGIQFQRGIVTGMYQQIKNLDATEAAWVEARLKDFNDKEDPKMQAYFVYLSKVPAETSAQVTLPAPPAPDQGQGGGGKKDPPKPNTTLKPDKLTLENSPVEYKHWSKRFRAFYRTSQLEKLNVMDQREYFNECLDASLAGIMEVKAPDALRVLSEDPTERTCLSLLDQIWQDRYPLNVRRHAYFGLRFSGGMQDVQAFVSQLEELASVADIRTMTESNINAYRALSAIQDTELRKLCFNEPDLTMERFRILAMERVREDEQLKAFKKDVKVQQTSAETTVYAVTKANAICYRCAGKGHYAHECRKPPKPGYKGKTAYVRQAEAEDDTSPESSSSDESGEVNVNAVQKCRKSQKSHQQKSKSLNKKKAKARAVEATQKQADDPVKPEVTSNVMAILNRPLDQFQ